MSIDFLKRVAFFVVLVVVQALVLNHIHLFGCAIPLLYVYFMLGFRRDYPRWGILAWSFLMGLSMDMFTNTQGLAAASLTFVGLLQPYLFQAFIPRDSSDNIEASWKTLGTAKYLTYSFLMIFVYCVVLFSLESFQFFNWEQWAMNISGSALLTWLFVLVIENVRS